MTKWQYAIIVDAGSSGSRVHVYRWLNSDRALQEADERQGHSLPEVRSKKHWTKKIKPGISTFGEKPDRVGPDHLQELLSHALDIVPKSAVPDTPIYLLATAGVRLLDKAQQRALLDETCSYFRKNSDFLLPRCSQHIQVISGQTEGLYGWIAANYLLGSLDAPKAHDHGKGHHTYGFLEMGGASAQIAFAPNATEAEKHADDLTLLRFRTIDGSVSEYRLFVTTWLKFGVNEARRRYVEALLGTHGRAMGELPDPCLPRDLRISTTGDILAPDQIDGRKLQLVGTGDFKACLARTYPLLEKDKPCPDAPCLLNGVHVPAIDFDVNHFVGVSEYWHTTHEIFEMAHRDKAYDLATYQRRVHDFCSQSWPDIDSGLKADRWGRKVSASTAAEVCFKASWIINILHEGIGVPRVGHEAESGSTGTNGTTKAALDGARDRGFTDAFQAVNKIDGMEVSWTLGRAVLYASSAVPPRRNNTLPVGFGANVGGGMVPSDFQLGGPYRSPRPNSTMPGLENDHGLQYGDGDSGWRDTLFHGRTPRRVPGFLLFLLIVLLAAFFLVGRDRRKRLLRRCCPRCLGGAAGSGGRRRVSKPYLGSAAMAHVRATDGLLEAGLQDADDVELGALDDAWGTAASSYADLPRYRDDDDYLVARGGRTGLTSGAATPALRGVPPPHLGMHPDAADSMDPRLGGGGGGGVSGLAGSNGGSSSGLVGLGLGGRGSAMDRSGLVPRTDSRERLAGLGAAPDSSSGADAGRRSRSRRGSPTRFKSPLMASLTQD